ncbi:MAG: M18 family aminopeptidase, partial [Oscillospiraceae bacterium]|nr:M18 family aminopeptidase [Oscillospiraceae bacterium]
MKHTAELFKFIDESKSTFHAVAAAKKRLEKAGYLALNEHDSWHLEPRGKYYVTRNLSSIIAFSVPEQGFAPMLITASHSDSPTFKIKENGTIAVQNQYFKLNTEGYGGMLCSTWFDRPLSVAGRLLVKTEFGLDTR